MQSNWDNWFDLAKKYYEHYGDLDVPRSFKTIDGINESDDGFDLGVWICHQRAIFNATREGVLTLDQIKKLNSIGMIWNKHELKWQKSYKLAKNYFEYYGDLDVPNRFKTTDGINSSSAKSASNLGYWIADQRSLYKGKKGSYTLDKVKMLNSIGMIWDKKKQISEMTMIIDKFKIKHKKDLRNIPVKEALAKIEFLRENNIPIEDENGLNQIFYMTDDDMFKVYGVTSQELIKRCTEKVK